ncbi:hypothetical protein CYY_005734 [Polysphondylium violaceum]|uniref:Alpha-1,3/1,6-mannosyltransferase ALG2 n=1 Tax=Polysphondylium violaceum TaxID=133409 RepID=A0A8J4Q2F8_9MYCE|nr:hypothetical protein CYY_005734 [Polysphondylium violaceum]
MVRKSDKGRLNIGILHPDLGIGGAERLIVDVALALKASDHKVKLYTSRHDPNRCFTETANGEIDVIVAGNWFPRHIFNRLMVVCAMVRNILAALYMIFFSKEVFDVVVLDQISVSVPLFKLFTRSKVLFYCHHPDKLLTTRESLLKKVYRLPIDWFEEYTTSFSDQTLVNSIYTGNVFKQSFPRIKKTPSVLYPCLDTVSFDNTTKSLSNVDHQQSPSIKNLTTILKDKKYILSINRYERKKNLMLALESFSVLETKISVEQFSNLHLVFAGGYDPGLRENVEHLQELKKRAEELNLQDKVTFLCSIKDDEKNWLLNHCLCLVYTPAFEHFGITPLEGMYAAKPVIAVNNGGPLETVKDGETGYLCEQNSIDFSEAYKKIVLDGKLCKSLGERAKQWVVSEFSFKSFTKKLNHIILNKL